MALSENLRAAWANWLARFGTGTKLSKTDSDKSPKCRPGNVRVDLSREVPALSGTAAKDDVDRDVTGCESAAFVRLALQLSSSVLKYVRRP